MTSRRATPRYLPATVACLLLAAVAPALQGQDVEPNQPCPAAQDLGAPALPVNLAGSLDSTPEQPDIDFFRLQADALAVPELVISMFDGPIAPSIDAALLGAFDADCNLLGVSSSAPFNEDAAMLRVTTPADGVVIVATTTEPDFDFAGGGTGSYELFVHAAPPLIRFSGRIVDAQAGAPLPGASEPFAQAALRFCPEPPICSIIDAVSTGADGRFELPSPALVEPLEPGYYQVLASAVRYHTASTELIEVDATAGNTDVGDLAIEPLLLIRSIRGRVVEKVSNRPLAGEAPPFTMVTLERCDDDFCFPVQSAVTDGGGLYRFDGFAGGLEPGQYVVSAVAEPYEAAASERFEVAPEEHAVAPRLRLRGSTPVVFTDVAPCADLPPTGGSCAFSVTVQNRGRRTQGGVWTVVTAGNTVTQTAFQPAPAQDLTLEPGQTAKVAFAFDVPPDAPADSAICPMVNYGQGGARSRHFRPLGSAFAFCVVREDAGFRVLTGAAARRARRALATAPAGRNDGARP